MIFHNQKLKRGVTILEMLFVVAVLGMFFILLNAFQRNVFSLNKYVGNQIVIEDQTRVVLKDMVKELRTATQSSLGGYPLFQTATSSLIFFSNIDSDAVKERVRYFLDVDGHTLKKGVTEPTGNPLTYNLGGEVVTTLIQNVRNDGANIFDYYDGLYAGTTTPISVPVQAVSVRLVKITLTVDTDPNNSPIPFIITSQVTIRNLKDNQ